MLCWSSMLSVFITQPEANPKCWVHSRSLDRQTTPTFPKSYATMCDERATEWASRTMAATADGLLHIELINQEDRTVGWTAAVHGGSFIVLARHIGNCFMFIMAIANGHLLRPLHRNVKWCPQNINHRLREMRKESRNSG